MRRRRHARLDDYVSDPAQAGHLPPRPIAADLCDGLDLAQWLVDDQRFADGRPDVLTYDRAAADRAAPIAGAPVVNLFASTSGTDSDWVVKLIDVYPDEVSGASPSWAATSCRRDGHLPRPLPRRAPSSPTPIAGEPARWHTASRCRNAEPRLPARPPDHGAGPVELVPALRPQPADLRAQHLLRAAPGLCEATQRVFTGAEGSWVGLPIVK